MATCSVDGIESLLREVGLDTPVPLYPGANIVHNPQDIFRAYLADTLQKLVNCDRSVACEAIQATNVTGMGDLVVVSPRLRLKDIKPKDVVADLAKRLPNSPPFTCPIADGIHLRVLSSPQTLPRLLLPYIKDRMQSYGYDASVGAAEPAADGCSRKKMVVEFSSPNMASVFQVSHLRSTLVGAYVANMYESLGWDVVRLNYLGDWGKQIGLLAAGWQRFGNDEEFARDPMRHMLEVNSKIEELFRPEQDASKTAKQEHKTTTEIETHGIYAERDDFFKKMEDRDDEALALWKRFRDATVEHYKNSYARLGVTFNEYSGESQVSSESVAEVESVLKANGVYEESEGSWILDFSKHNSKGLSTAILRYRNGTTSYLLRDVAAVLDRLKAHDFEKMIYVVAVEQEMHFNRVIKVLTLMGRDDLASKLQHVPFAKITVPGDEFKGARLLDDYIDGSQTIARNALAEMDAEEVYLTQTDDALLNLGVASLFVQDMSHKRTTSYACDIKHMTDINEETGPSFMNCYARLLSTLQGNPGAVEDTTINHSELETEDYTELLRIMAQYSDAVLGSYKALEPSVVVGYIFRLVDQLMVTLDDDNEQDWTGREDTVKARMALYESARQVFENALKLLGVSPLGP